MCPLNYIAEINAFYNWAMLNPVPADAQALWHVLMQINNRSAIKIGEDWYWRVEFTVSNSTLTSVLAISRQQLDRMRNVLIQLGRIAYRKGKGSQSGKYRLVPFDANYVTQTVTQPVSQMDTQTVTQIWAQTGRLCNIFGTLINSNNKQVISISGDGDEGARPVKKPMPGGKPVGDHPDGYLSGLDSYFGITGELKTELTAFAGRLFTKYFGRQATEADLETAFEYIRGIPEGNESDGYSLSFPDESKKLLECAFGAAQLAGAMNWNYIQGVWSQIGARGINSEDEFHNYEHQRKRP